MCAIDCGRTRSASRERARRLRPVAVEPREDGALRDREAVLGPQPAHELAEHDPQLAGCPGDARCSRHASDLTGKLNSMPVDFGTASPQVDDTLQVGGALEHDPRDAARDDRLVDHARRDARRLPRHPARPARLGQQLLPALDDPRLPRRHERPRRQPRPARRPVRARADVHARLPRVHRRVAPAVGRLAARACGRRLADRLPRRAGHRRRVPARQRRRDPHRRVPAPTSAGSRSGSPMSSRSAASSSASSSAASWRRSTGA